MISEREGDQEEGRETRASGADGGLEKQKRRATLKWTGGSADRWYVRRACQILVVEVPGRYLNPTRQPCHLFVDDTLPQMILRSAQMEAFA